MSEKYPLKKIAMHMLQDIRYKISGFFFFTCKDNGKERIEYRQEPIKFDVLQAAVVQTLDSAIHRIKIYPIDSAVGFPNTYPLDSDL